MKNMNKTLLAMMLLASQMNYAEDGVPSESSFATGMVQAMQDQVSEESYLTSLYHKFLAWIESSKMSDQEREDFYENDEDSHWSKEQDKKFADRDAKREKSERDIKRKQSDNSKNRMTKSKVRLSRREETKSKGLTQYKERKEQNTNRSGDKPSGQHHSASIVRARAHNDGRDSVSLLVSPTNTDDSATISQSVSDNNSFVVSPSIPENWEDVTDEQLIL